MMKFATSLVIGSSLFSLSHAECPNACSSHGICTNYDMCQCYRNWMSNDCSERVCQFGLAHVDTPKGDLDASSGKLTGPEKQVIVNSEVYPYGTTEQFPNMVDSNGNVLANSAHYYQECSNKGICDRAAGTCECFPGYEGSACQRASCPSNEEGVCSGHGTCQSIKEISTKDYNNIYELWDKSATLGCVCDAGYYGADCSLRQCKYGADPLYADDSIATPRFANWTYGIYTKTKGTPATITGNYSIAFYDVFGEDWRTEPIQYGSVCPEIINALESLPNNVIPPNSVLCLNQDAATTLTGKAPYTGLPGDYYYHQLVTLIFPGNVGQLKQVEIDIYLDGPRPTLVSNEVSSTLGTFVYANGFHGEFSDYVPDYCEGVEVTLNPVTNRIIDLTTAEEILLKRCLGSSDFDSTNNKDEVFNWDYGSQEYPHLVKFVEANPTYSRICNSTNTWFAPNGELGWCENNQPAGFYAPVIYQSSYFTFFNKINTIYSASTPFRVFTTKGTLQKVNSDFDIRHTGIFQNTVRYWSSTGHSHSHDCETYTSATGTCLNKGDRVMFLNTNDVSKNPEYHNMYTVKKVGRRDVTTSDETEIVLDMGINFAHIDQIYAYKFTPPTNGGVSWAAECSDRGVCDSASGVCKCFKGYTNDDCSVQNTLAK
jgi:hypothetical protein